MIDSHQHFWKLADRGGAWPPLDLAAIYRDFEPADILPHLTQWGVQGTVLVQTLQTNAETGYMLNLADRHDFILGVVGWVDLKATNASAEIKRLATHPKLKGLRPMLQDLADDHWIDDASLELAIRAMLDCNLSFDALVKPQHLPALLRFAQRFPNLSIVIDHAAKPLIAAQKLQPWADDMRALAALPNVWCKLSGMLTEGGKFAHAAGLAPYVEIVVNAFGPARLMWGSDWPVLNLVSDYATWLSMCQRVAEQWTPQEQAAFFAGNAARFYRLQGPNN